MSKKRNSLKRPRLSAFSKQNGCCFYCRQPMWADDPSALVSEYGISIGDAKQLKCTGEHLIAHKDGGNSGKENIVAACWFCNKQRHNRKTDLTSEQYKKMVRNRMYQGRWHGLCLTL